MASDLMSRRVLAGVACALSLAACGSRADFTVVRGGVGSVQQEGGTAPSADGSVVPGSVGTTGADAAAPGTVAGGTAVGPGVAGAPGTAVGRPGGTGLTAPVRLAYLIQDSAGVGAITGANVAQGDSDVARRTMDALVAYANAHGGVGGRRISARGFVSQATSTTADRLALCKQITEDYKGQVVLDQNQYLVEEGWACFAQHHAVYAGTVTATSKDFLARNAPYITTTWLSLDRSMRALLVGAERTGYFKDGKVGVVLADVPTLHRLYETLLKPGLVRAGVKDPMVRYISNSSADTAQQAQTNAAVLAFASAGVNRVMWFHNLIPYLLFTHQSDSQGYRPRYAFSDYQTMTGVAAFYGSASQNEGAIGVSSSPNSIPDDASYNATDATKPYDRKTLTAGAIRCLDLLSKQTGKNYYDPQASGDSLATWAWYCDEFLAWWEAAKALGAAWTPALHGKGLATLGSSYLSAIQHSTRFTSGVFDGASSFRVGRFNSSCSCFPKVSEWIPV
jgi:hypothetical protein